MLQQKNQNVIQRANERGVVAARRRVSGKGQRTLQRVLNAIEPELGGAAHLFNVKRIGVNIIGFSRFDQEHQDQGPPTKDVVAEVLSSQNFLRVGLGRIGVYGSETKAKLGISLISDRLRWEEEDIEMVFDKLGFPLQPGPYRDDGFVPHVSIGRLDINQLEYFQSSETLRRLDELAGLGHLATRSLSLDPIKAESMPSY
jgi:hypothetical protein